jgi:hypothetical protein
MIPKFQPVLLVHAPVGFVTLLHELLKCLQTVIGWHPQRGWNGGFIRPPREALHVHLVEPVPLRQACKGHNEVIVGNSRFVCEGKHPRQFLPTHFDVPLLDTLMQLIQRQRPRLVTVQQVKHELIVHLLGAKYTV